MQHITHNTAQFWDNLWHKRLSRPYRLHYYDHGGSGPVIVLLHGIASSSDNWIQLIPLLKQDYRCVSLDLLGFGQSPKPLWCTYTIDDHIRAIEATIRSLHLRNTFTLVGHSMGSLFATRYARLQPRRVQRLILLSPPVYAPLDTIPSRSARRRTSFYLRMSRFLRGHKGFTPENIIRLRRIFPQLKYMALNRATWTPLIRSLEHCIEQQSLIEDIREVQAPVDIFYGIFDELIVPYNVKQLTKIRDVRLHPLRLNHVVGKRYSRAVAQLLASPIIK
jgi:pimeloyl-ACP methyl ester carboxylesterase